MGFRCLKIKPVVRTVFMTVKINVMLVDYNKSIRNIHNILIEKKVTRLVIFLYVYIFCNWKKITMLNHTLLNISSVMNISHNPFIRPLLLCVGEPTNIFTILLFSTWRYKVISAIYKISCTLILTGGIPISSSLCVDFAHSPFDFLGWLQRLQFPAKAQRCASS